MSFNPHLTTPQIADHVREVYALDARRISPIAGRMHAKGPAYRIDSPCGSHFLKLGGNEASTASSFVRYLGDAGVTHVPMPVSTLDRQGASAIGGFTAILYPFIEGENGFRTPLKEGHWITLGAALRTVHDVKITPRVRKTLRSEDYSDIWRRKVRGYLSDSSSQSTDDGVMYELVRLLDRKRSQIEALVDHAEVFAETLTRTALPIVACHGDLHAGNVLVSGDRSLTIIDWDDPVLAPKERDLMFIGAGIGGAWNRPEESEAFYLGYGPTAVQREAIAYYRCDRIVEDVATFYERLLPGGARDADRPLLLRKLAAAFDPGDVVELAEQTWATL